MISGFVTAQLEPRIHVYVEDDTGQTLLVDADVDTGYTGYLTLSSATITSLGLKWVQKRPFELADDTTTHLDVFSAIVIWDSTPRTVEVLAVGRTPLVGMKMLAGHELRIRVVDGGPVWIDIVP